MNTKLFTFLLTACASSAPVLLPAAVVLQVDVSNPAAVVITATSANSQNEFLPPDGGTINTGVTMIELFSGNNVGAGSAGVTSGSLNALEGLSGTDREVLDLFWNDSFTGGFTPEDLSIFQPGAFELRFETDEQALTGSIVVDLSSISSSFFPTIGTTGNIVANSPDLNNVIGQWQVIPEASTGLLGLMAGLMLLQRRRT
ncbi:MAG: hypothetical protein AAGA58_11070 [Verrucomicrobiota bacterium]